MFYNTENFFDTRNDSLTDDDAFTPDGDMHWNQHRYHIKLNNLYKTIIALGEWNPPDVIGLCEVENRHVLSDLLNGTPLSKYAYRMIHADSKDRRGIDVALLYNSQTVSYIRSRFHRISKEGLNTRDILYFAGLLYGDTCHFFINHWPSRSAGQLKTETERLAAASTLHHLVDSLVHATPGARIIIMGDFNDEPGDESLSSVLKAGTNLRDPRPGNLYNLSRLPLHGNVRGTLKFQGQWNLFDQLIVSGNLLDNTRGIYIPADGYRIFGADFLLAADEKFAGYKPYRTYTGYSYTGGFSDHLPVYADLCRGL